MASGYGLAAGISGFTDGFIRGREERRDRERQEADDAWRERSRAREEQNWDWQDKQREREEVDWEWTDSEREHLLERRPKLEAHDDKRMAAESIGYDDTLQHGAQDLAESREHQRTTRKLDVEGKRLAQSATRQSMAQSADANRRANESHEWQRARNAAVTRQLQASERYLGALSEIAPMMATDPAAAGTRIAEVINASRVNGSGKVGIGYDPESGRYAISLVRNGKKISGGPIAQDQLLDQVRMVLDPVGFGGDFAAKAAERAKQYQDTLEDRRKWEREQMAEMATMATHELPEAADRNQDGRVTEAEMAAYVKLLGNMLFEETPRFLPTGAPKKEQDGKRKAAGVSAAAAPQESAPAAGAPKPGTVVDGFRFKGGNPNDPNSWEQV